MLRHEVEARTQQLHDYPRRPNQLIIHQTRPTVNLANPT